MGKIIIDGIECGGSFSDANKIYYDDTNTELGVGTVQEAIEATNSNLNELFARTELLNAKPTGTYSIDCTPYSRFYIEFMLNGGSVKFPCYIPVKSLGGRYRVAYTSEVYADVTINASDIVVNVVPGSYTDCSVFVWGYK